MKDTIIVSGGNIQKDFALDFLKKNKTEKVEQNTPVSLQRTEVWNFLWGQT